MSGIYYPENGRKEWCFSMFFHCTIKNTIGCICCIDMMADCFSKRTIFSPYMELSPENILSFIQKKVKVRDNIQSSKLILGFMLDIEKEKEDFLYLLASIGHMTQRQEINVEELNLVSDGIIGDPKTLIEFLHDVETENKYKLGISFNQGIETREFMLRVADFQTYTGFRVDRNQGLPKSFIYLINEYIND